MHNRSGLVAVDVDGRRLDSTVTRLECSRPGSLRTVVVLEGVLARQSRTVLTYVLRLHFFAGLATIRHELTLRNPARAEHRGGFWELGDPGSVLLREVSVVMALPEPVRATEIVCSPELGQPLLSCVSHLDLYQDSSGFERWQSSNHLTATGELSVSFRGYTLRTDGSLSHGLHATPVVSLRAAIGSLSVGMSHFWQNFPKAIRATATDVTLALFPPDTRHPHELQGGEQKTHGFEVAFGRDPVTTVPLDWCRSPLRVNADPEWYCKSQVVKYLLPAAADPNADYLALIQSALAGGQSFEAKRQVIDEYGWRHFGDLYADHEAVHASDPSVPFVSHYNNQYDAIAGFARHFLRSGDWRWWWLMNDLASHVVDIDIYHTDRDKAAYNGGLFWHTDHCHDAGKATHRTFPKADGVRGGGPSPDHNYTTGLLLHYYLTGNEQSKETAIGLARWVMAMDDGRSTPFRWLSASRTGLISFAGGIGEHGPGRAAGNSVNALVDAFHLTDERVYLIKAEELITRCIHPADDIASRNLLDAELRWYYTVFLQAVGKYLDCKAEIGSLDRMYAYARASLIAYARWMALHERPYLDHPERLQYPTETWAAQEMRKSEVFRLAALHADPGDRVTFRERSEFFFNYSVQTLMRMPTSTFTRPMVLLLSNGYTDGYFRNYGELTAPRPSVVTTDFGAPERFVSQRVQAKRRAAWVFVSVVVVLIGGALLAVGW